MWLPAAGLPAARPRSDGGVAAAAVRLWRCRRVLAAGSTRAIAEEVVAGGERNEARARDQQAASREVQQEEQEESVVVEAHAVVHPRAVMVHLHDASVADRAVVRAHGLEHAALLAEARRLALAVLHRRIDGGCVVARVAGPREDARPVIEEDVEEHPEAEAVYQRRRKRAEPLAHVRGSEHDDPLVRAEPDEPVGSEDEQRAQEEQ